MPKDYKVYLEDIMDAITKIEKYTKNLTFSEFRKNELVTDATVRNLEIIGEAVKQILNQIKNKASDIEWKKSRGCETYLSTNILESTKT